MSTRMTRWAAKKIGRRAFRVMAGRPPDFTVRTCAAGAGSIDTGRWHGFLHNGVLRA